MEDEEKLLTRTAADDPVASRRSLETSDGKRRFRFGCTVALILMACLLFCAVGFSCGLFLGWKFRSDENSSSGGGGRIRGLSWGSNVSNGSTTQSMSEWLSNKLNSENIKNNLRNLTSKPHIAGKEQVASVADYLYNTYSQYNFDLVEMTNYSVLLTYVNRSNYNSLKILSENQAVLYTAHIEQETPRTDGEDDPNVAPPFNAYSAAGEASGPLVYVNYGRIEDFLYLVSNLSLNISGRVCIARYGKIFRGDKAHLAQKFGCIGLIIYSDPMDYAPHGGPATYPDGPSLPSGGVQRGSVQITDGDPLTPGVPSLDEVYRRKYEDVVASGAIPAIPVQPISYGDAVHFMNQLDTMDSPADWKGQLESSYKILQSNNNNNLTILKVNNVFERRTIRNIFAYVYGTVEPDRMVLFGNHYDAWTFGAVDPNSGTAVIMDIARVISDLRSTGWRPGRTIVLCSWDAEEYGLIGSTEWVEDVEKLLGANAVAYINVDSAVSGMAEFVAVASPLLFDVIYNATQQVPCPCKDFSTLYDQWKSGYQSPQPKINNLGSGTDYTYFIQKAGVTSSDFSYAYTNNNYPVYHSVHDNFYWMTHFGDPDFSHHVALGEVWIRIVMAIATTPILPYNVVSYYERLAEMYNELDAGYGEQLTQNNISTSFLQQCLSEFQTAANNLQTTLATYTDSDNLNIVRILNNKLMNIERAFLVPEGLPGRSYFKHVIFAPSSVNSYSAASFPGVVDALFNATSIEDWNFVHQQLDIVAIHIRYATQIMNQTGIEWVNN